MKKSEVATMIQKNLKKQMKSKETFEIQICTYGNNEFKCFDELLLHQNCIDEQDCMKETLFNFELKDRLNF